MADYTDRDYAALMVREQALAQQQFPAWTDYNEANFGNQLLQAFAFIGDILSYYQDNQAGESRITTAQQRRNMIGLLKLIQYEMSGATAAQHTVTFSIASALGEDIIIPAGTIVKTRESTPTEFQLLAAVTITAGNTSVNGTAEHSQFWDDETWQVDGSTGQVIKLGRTPFLDDSLAVANGGYVQVDAMDYSEVSNFLDSISTDKHYTVTVDENDRAYIRFGDGVNGVAPSGTLTVKYKTGGGVAGNVEAAAIKDISGTLTTVGGTPVSVAVTNAAGASILGTDRESIETARTAGPASLRALERTVSRTDFEDNARLVTGVGRALAITKNEAPLVLSLENTTYVYIVPTGGGTPSAGLKTNVDTMYSTTRPVMVTHVVDVKDPTYATINIVCWVYLTSGAVAATVKAAIVASLTTFFEPVVSDATADDYLQPNSNVNFGYYMRDENDDPEPSIRWSDINAIVKNTAGVRKVGTPVDGRATTLNGAADDYTINLVEFPKLGTVAVWNGDTGAEIP